MGAAQSGMAARGSVGSVEWRIKVIEESLDSIMQGSPVGPSCPPPPPILPCRMHAMRSVALAKACVAAAGPAGAPDRPVRTGRRGRSLRQETGEVQQSVFDSDAHEYTAYAEAHIDRLDEVEVGRMPERERATSVSAPDTMDEAQLMRLSVRQLKAILDSRMVRLH